MQGSSMGAHQNRHRMVAAQKNYTPDQKPTKARKWIQKLENGQHATQDTEQQIQQCDMRYIFVND